MTYASAQTLTGGRTALTNPRVAVIGCGHWGKNLVRNFSELGGLVAVHDPEPAIASKMSAEFRVPAMAWTEVLASRDVQAVAIAAPAVLHYKLASEALAAGKHVFVEKPIAVDVAEAAELCATADKRGLTLMVGHLLQYHPAFLRLKELVGEGALGRLQYVYSNRLNLGKIRREENALWSFAPHDISMILSLVGAEPEHVTATGANYLHGKVADVTTTHLTFADGTQAHVFVSWLHPFKEQKLVAVGDRAMAVFDDGQPWASKLVIYRHQINWRDGIPQPMKAEGEPVPLKEAEPLKLECTHYLDSLRHGTRPRTDGYEGLRVLRVLQAAQEDMSAQARPAPRAAVPAAARASDVQIHESAFVDQPVTIGEGSRVWHFSHVMPNARIGRDCVIGQNVMVGGSVVIGDRCKVQNNVSIYQGVTLEDGVFCGPSCVFTNVMNPRAEIERKNEFRPTLVKRGATIGANATIVCGHTLGEYCFIGAGAVVTRDVPAYALMMGNPARRMGWMSRAGGRLGSDLVCPIDGTRYRELAPDQLVEVRP